MQMEVYLLGIKYIDKHIYLQYKLHHYTIVIKFYISNYVEIIQHLNIIQVQYII